MQTKAMREKPVIGSTNKVHKGVVQEKAQLARQGHNTHDSIV